MRKTTALVVLCLLAYVTNADETKIETIFAGAGGKNSDTEWPALVVGAVFEHLEKGYTWGFDIAMEGSLLDSTGNSGWSDDIKEKIKPSFSFNLLAGFPVYKGRNWRVNAMVLGGIIQTEITCPPSYLEFRCYADEDPEVSYALQAGGMASFHHKKGLHLGIRVTQASTQITFGRMFGKHEDKLTSLRQWQNS